MREKSNKFRKGQGKRKKSVALKKDDISWLSKNTHFDPDTVTEWHKVRIFRYHFNILTESGAVKSGAKEKVAQHLRGHTSSSSLKCQAPQWN